MFAIYSLWIKSRLIECDTKVLRFAQPVSCCLAALKETMAIENTQSEFLPDDLRTASFCKCFA